ncbi:TRAP transporter large permease subunit, partial [Nitrospirota bacterium]
MSALIIGVLLALAAIFRTPLFAVILASALLGFLKAGIDLSVVAIELYRLAEMPVLLAIPLFTFAGYLLSESQAPSRLVRLTRALIGWVPGGLAVVSLVACAAFTAFTGVSGVTIIALGALLYPALNQAGYPKRFNLGLVTTSGSLGLLFAPSLPLILFVVVAQQTNTAGPLTIEMLFKAGLMPGILMIVLLSAFSLWVNRKNKMPIESVSLSEIKAAIKESAWEIPLPVVVLGGIYGGVFAVSEAAAITAM